MLDKLKEFLINQSEKNAALSYNKIWHHKVKFLVRVIIEYLIYFESTLGQKDDSYYKNNINQLKDCFDKVHAEGMIFNVPVSGESREVKIKSGKLTDLISCIRLISNDNSPSYRIIEPLVKKAFDDNYYVKNFKLFLSSGYSPPIDPIEILKQLFFLYFYHTAVLTFQPKIPLSVRLRMDLVMSQLISHTQKMIYRIDKVAFTLDRTHKSTKTRRDSIDRMKKLVWKEYEDFRNTTDTTLIEEISKYKYRLARILQQRLGISSPDKVDTIVKYLNEYHDNNNTTPPWR